MEYFLKCIVFGFCFGLAGAIGAKVVKYVRNKK